MPLDAFEEVLRLNLHGSVVPTMIVRRDDGRGAKRAASINISSMAALRQLSGVLGYSVAKTGIDSFTRWMAVELARKYGDGLRVNAIAPGFFVTTQNRDVLLTPDGELHRALEAHHRADADGTLRPARGAARRVRFLCSDSASFVTGTVIPVDGGFSILQRRMTTFCPAVPLAHSATCALARSIERAMKIIDIRATPVTVPLAAPLRHANGSHWGRFVRTIVEVETDEGIIGLGEMGGGGESAVAAFNGLKPYLLGHDPTRLEEMRFVIANPTASLYNNRTQILAALEFACLDILGQKWGVPVHAILGGALRDRVPFASYLFFRYPNDDDGGRGPHARPARRRGARAQEHARLHVAQAEGRRVSRRRTSSSAIARSPTRCRATASASIRTACGRPSRRSGSASRSRT